MAIEYLACGNIMSDQIMDADGNLSERNMGGPAFYALAGMRLWTPDCKLVCKAGADYADSYGRWMDDNRVPKTSVQVEAEHCSAFILKYREDGAFIPSSVYSSEHLGYLKTHPEDIDRACEGEAVKGIYMAHNMDPVIWKKLGEVKKKHGFQIMWEIEYAEAIRKQWGLSREEVLEKIERVLLTADMWSLNNNEASDLFDLPREDDGMIIKELQKLPAAFTFYRVGNRGAYGVTPTEAYFCPCILPFGPSVDPTGCGNNSTGAAMQSYVAGDHPAMAVVKACVSAGFNAAQRGPCPLYTEEIFAYAKALAEEYFEKVMAGVTVHSVPSSTLRDTQKGRYYGKHNF